LPVRRGLGEGTRDIPRRFKRTAIDLADHHRHLGLTRQAYLA
jgi:hypothetical protein